MYKHTYIILHDLRSAYNVGSILRTADAAGVSKVYMVGTTPTPIDRFGRVQKEISKTALGAENSVEWEYVNSFETLYKKLKENGTRLVVVEQDEKATDYKKHNPRDNEAYLFGAEVGGVPSGVISLADEVIDIPMHGEKESLNVAVAVGVVLFNVLD